MIGKKFVNIIIPLKAISPRNITSLALVGVFFAVYVIAGGKIGPAPKVGPGFVAPKANAKSPNKLSGDVVEKGSVRQLSEVSAIRNKAQVFKNHLDSEEDLTGETEDVSQVQNPELDDSNVYKNLQDRIKRSGAEKQ